MKKLLTILLIFITTLTFSQCVPVLHYDGCDLEVVSQSNYVYFQWYRGNIPIEYEGNEFTYEPIESGMYMCQTIDQYGCMNFSKRYRITNWCGVGVINNQ